MKKLSILLLLILLDANVLWSQTDMCFGCFPAEPISASTIHDLRLSHRYEGVVFDISLANDDEALVILMNGRGIEDSLRIAKQTYQEIYLSMDDENQELVIWDALSSIEITRNDNLTQIAYNPLGNKVAIGTSTGEVQFWDLEDNTLDYTAQGQGAIGELLFTSDGAIAIEGGHYLGWHDMDGNTKYLDLPATIESLDGLAISPDDNWLVTITSEGFLFYSYPDFILEAQITTKESVGDLVFDPSDPTKLYVMTDQITLWEWTESPVDIEQIGIYEQLFDYTKYTDEQLADFQFIDAAMSPDGSLLASVDTLGCTRLFGTQDFLEIITEFSIKNCNHNSQTIEITNDGLWLTLLQDNSLTFWVIPTSTCVPTASAKNHCGAENSFNRQRFAMPQTPEDPQVLC